MKRIYFYMTLITLLLALLAGCGQPAASNTPAASPDQPDGDASTDAETPEAPEAALDPVLDQVTAALDQGGYPYTVGDEETGDVLYEADSLRSLDLSQAGEASVSISIYRYETPEEAKRISEGFSADDPSCFGLEQGDSTTGMVVDYADATTFYLCQDSIVVYCGGDEAVRALLAETLGRPFAETSSFGATAPYFASSSVGK